MRCVAGAILAGGSSRRFGRDKAAEPYRGRRLIDWSIAALAPHVDMIFIIGRPHPDHPTITDLPRSGMGPLGGIAGALGAAEAAGCTRLVTLPCDTPHLPAELFELLLAAEGAAFVKTCPVIGIWPVTLAKELVQYLEQCGPRAMRAWTDHIGAAGVGGEFIIDNINTAADMAELEHRSACPPARG